MKDYYKEKKVSSSSLSWFETSPKIFRMMMDQEIDEEYKSFYDKGQQYHMYILEPEQFDKEYTFLDYESPKSKQQKDFCDTLARLKKGKKEEKLVKAYKSSYSTKESDEKILEKAKLLEKDFKNYINFIKISPLYTKVLPNSALYQLNEAKTEILNHKKAKELLFNEKNSVFGNSDELFIKNEFEIYWEYPGNIQCKSMLDRVIIDHKNKKIILIDLKTTSHMSDFKEKFIEYKYYRQLAFYWLAIQWYYLNELKMELNEYSAETYIVAISTKNPTEIKVFKVSEPQLSQGLNEIIKLMEEIKWHYENNLWDYTRKYHEGDGIEIIL